MSLCNEADWGQLLGEIQAWRREHIDPLLPKPEQLALLQAEFGPQIEAWIASLSLVQDAEKEALDRLVSSAFGEVIKRHGG